MEIFKILVLFFVYFICISIFIYFIRDIFKEYIKSVKREKKLKVIKGGKNSYKKVSIDSKNKERFKIYKGM